MNQNERSIYYRLDELEQTLQKCEDDIAEKIDELKIKEGNGYFNYLLYTVGKSFVTTREIICLCQLGFPDGALSLARNLYEQFINTLYIEKYNQKPEMRDILNKYYDDYAYQRAKCLIYEAEHLNKNEDKIKEYQDAINEIKIRNNLKEIKDYWWTNNKKTTFSGLCETVIKDNKNAESLLRLMHLMYKRACLSLHASCMGNRIRLGSNIDGIDMGPWEEGQESALFLTTASLVYIVTITYKSLDIEWKTVNKALNDLTIFYQKLMEKRAKRTTIDASMN